MATTAERLVSEAKLATELAAKYPAPKITGTGIPVGVVTPVAVGQQYVDTAKTAGAIVWTATGTTSANWAVSHGDSGNRVLPCSNGWTGNVIFRRINATVQVIVDGINGSAQTSNIALAAIPDMFRTANGARAGRGLLHVAAATGTPVTRRYYIQNDLFIYDSATVGAFHGDIVPYLTDRAWPVTLPGTAL